MESLKDKLKRALGRGRGSQRQTSDATTSRGHGISAVQGSEDETTSHFFDSQRETSHGDQVRSSITPQEFQLKEPKRIQGHGQGIRQAIIPTTSRVRGLHSEEIQRHEPGLAVSFTPQFFMEVPEEIPHVRPAAATTSASVQATSTEVESVEEEMNRFRREAAEQAAKVTAATASYYALGQGGEQQPDRVSSTLFYFGRPQPRPDTFQISSSQGRRPLNLSRLLEVPRLQEPGPVLQFGMQLQAKKAIRDTVPISSSQGRRPLNLSRVSEAAPPQPVLPSGMQLQAKNPLFESDEDDIVSDFFQGFRERSYIGQTHQEDVDMEENAEERRKRLQRERTQKFRAKLTEEQQKDIRHAKASIEALRRSQETEAETEHRRQADSVSHFFRRQQETLAETERRRQANAASHRNRVQQALNTRRTHLLQIAQRGVERFDETVVATHNCGPMNVICQFCNSRNFANERPSDKMFNSCCHKGKVKLTKPVNDRGIPLEYPLYLKSLMSDPSNRHYKNFRRNIRSYNSSLSFASMGAKIVQVPGHGPYVFKANGTIYHKTSHLDPHTNQIRKYAQLYILDSTQAVDARMELPENQRLRPEVIDQIDRFFRANNRLAQTYHMMRQVQDIEATRAINENRTIPVVSMAIRSDREADDRRYNLPTSNEIAMVFVDDDGEPPFDRDIRVYPRNPTNPNHRFINIDITNANLDPMTYALLFPYGQPGWHDKLISTGYSNADPSRQNKHITILQFKSALTAIRDDFNPIIHSGNLFHYWAVDSYLQVEANNLRFARMNQRALRADLYSGLADYVANRAAAAGVVAGDPVILPSTFEGSPRNMRQRLHDAMAIFAKYGSVDAFVTFTANPNWEEITSDLEPGETASDRPDLVTRVYKLKLDEFVRDLTVNRVLGRTVAWVYTIEFQKRGLPHCHMLIVFAEEDKFKSWERIDEVICAEIPDPVHNPRLHEIVTRCMLHGPCGAFKPDAPCMENGECSKEFPKAFRDQTQTNPNGYPKYRRRMGPSFQKGRHTFDNRHVVPYNKFLLLKYNAHINVEACTSMRAVKYIYKYIYKGFDCAKVSIGVDGQRMYIHDEISNYIDARYVSAPEAMWRLLAYAMHDRCEPVIQLPVHLPRQQRIQFEVGREREALDAAESGQTKLTAWFKLNCTNPRARSLLYTDIPHHYTFSRNAWHERNQGTVTSRMYMVGISDQERFCLRLLLLHVRGATSFEYLQTVDGVLYSTFKEAAAHRRLLSSDEEWDKTLQEAATYQMPSQMRQTFAHICIFCVPSNALALWDKYCTDMILDFVRTHDEPTSRNLALHDIESTLLQHGKQCTDFDLPAPTGTVDDILDFDTLEEKSIADRLIPTLLAEQRDGFDQIVDGIDNSSSHKLFFLNGPGGTGKTYLYNTLWSFIRGRGQTVLAFASTGIAATLMKNGTTIHSGFKLPVPLLEMSVSKIKLNSSEANAIRNAALLIVDEVIMLDKEVLRVIDLKLREIMQNNSPFGGKVLVLGGDFRQTLPIVPRGNKVDIIERCLKRSRFWHLFKEITLISNQRSRLHDEYNEWLLDIGVGNTAPIAGLSENAVEIPSHMITQEDVVKLTFGENIQDLTVDELSRRVILATTNKETLQINRRIINGLNGELKTYYSSDSIVSTDPNDVNNFPIEFLHEQTPSGVPPHELHLKVGAIVMLIRNLNRRKGLCNGTRLIVRGLHEMFISCEIISESHKGDIVFLSRIDITPSDSNLPFVLKRRQFPVIPAFAITINKSQGQTYDIVTLYLNEPVFGHGQLYVALSRSRNPANVKVYITEGRKQGRLLNDDRWFTENVVYREIFR